MAYDQDVIDAIAEELGRTNASPRVRKAAYEATLVETGGRNLNYGDRDSLGAFQQRPSQGWGTPRQILDPKYAAKQFVSRAITANATGKYKTAGQLAQAVQGSAFPDRYDTRGREAESILSRLGASPSGGAGTTTSAAPASSGSSSAAAPQALLGAPDQADFTSLLGSLLSGGEAQQQAPAPMQVAPPSFAAHAPTPQGFNPAQSSSAPAPQQQDGLSAALSLVGTLGTSTAGVGQGQASQPGIAEQVINGPKGIAETVMKTPSSAKGPDAALAWAKSKVGAPGSTESGGENHGKLADYANSRFGMSGQAWCAMFTSLAVTKGGAPSSARTASVAEVRRRALAGKGYEKGIVSPQAAQSGDLILFGDDHIGMVDRVENGKVFYVGGNQSDSVTEASVPVGSGDIVRPKYR